MKNFVDCSFITNFSDTTNLFILDCRFDLFNKNAGYEYYKKEHIPNAFYLDINKDICGKQSVHGGARPLANIYDLSKKLTSIGIEMNSTIVIYDTMIYSSPRAFLQLKYMGYENVYILNGGFNAWKSNKLPSTSKIPLPRGNSTFKENLNTNMVCDMNYIKNSIENNNIVLIDSRDNDRYTGKVEPIYSKPGHIPGAINIPWHKNIDDFGYVKDLSEVDTNFNNLKNKEIITYCGSCIEACINYALLDELSYNVKAYAGSISDWISYDDNLVQR